MAMTKRRWAATGAAVIVAVALIAAVAWFEPHKLFIDKKVNEAAPTVRTSTTAATTTGVSPSTTLVAAPTATTAPAPAVLAQGTFISRDHGTRGVAQVLDVGGGERVLRLEDFATDNGPAVYVYLSTNPADGSEGAFDDDFVNLGEMKGNVGNQNYAVGRDVDLARFKSVVIWCDRFDSAFGAADLA